MKTKTAVKLVKRIAKLKQEGEPTAEGQYYIESHPLKLKEFKSPNFKTHVTDVLKEKYEITITGHTENEDGKLVSIIFE